VFKAPGAPIERPKPRSSYFSFYRRPRLKVKTGVKGIFL